MELHGKEKFNSLYYKRLFEGIREFKANEYIPRQQFFEELGKKQNPHTLFIGCSDSRVVPNLITQTFPGELFVVRNIANLVPHYKRHSDTYLATTSAIEFAVNQMNVSNIVVCGHSNCGGCAALYQDKELKNLPHTKKWMELAHPVKKIVEQKIAKNKITLEERTLFTEQLNVVEQMNHLLKYSYIKKRVKEGKLNVMGC
jgi:carbonic anhydrase